jgi:hypothetical protein
MGDIRDHLIEAILRAAEQERARPRPARHAATAYEQNSDDRDRPCRRSGTASGDAIRLDLADASTWPSRDHALRRVTL